MWPYLIPIIFVFLMNLTKQGNIEMVCGRQRIHINKLILSLGVLFAFAALRGNGSGDYFSYLRMGKNITGFHKIFDNNIHMDIGYCFLAWIVNLFHLPSQAVIALMNMISIGAIGILIRRYSKFPMLSVLIFLPFYFQFDMHAARTACAIGIMTLSAPYILKRDFKRFLFILFIAVLFHPEAVIGIMLYFLPAFNINLKSSLVFIFVVFAILACDLSDKLVLAVLRMINLQNIYNRFLSYTQESNPMSYAGSLFDPRLFVALLIFLYSKISMIEKDRVGQFLVNTSYVNLLLMIFFNNHAVFIYRLSSFYGIFSIILLPLIFERAKKKSLDVNIRYQYQKVRYLLVIMYTVLSTVYAMKISVPYVLCRLTYW